MSDSNDAHNRLMLSLFTGLCPSKRPPANSHTAIALNHTTEISPSVTSGAIRLYVACGTGNGTVAAQIKPAMPKELGVQNCINPSRKADTDADIAGRMPATT
jgi:hypothetical protein